MTDRQSESVWRREILGWSLYDFANTIYSMNIVSLYLKRYIVEDLGHSDYVYDIPFSISMLAAGVLLPGLGALSDQSTKKKIFLFLFTLICCSAVGLMALVPAWAVWLTVVLFILANFSYEAGQPFYNALLYSIAEGKEARFVSGLGVAAGYVGSVLGMALVLPFVTGALFSLDVPFLAAGGKKAAFLPTAVLFLLFAIPLFFWVKERRVKTPTGKGFLGAYRDVWEALRQTKKYPGVVRFLVADYFVEDAVATVILNIGIYCSIVFSLDDQQITAFLIVSTVAAVAGSLTIGHLSRVFPLKTLLYVIIGGWAGTLLLFVVVDSMAVVWVLGSAVGVLMGGLWTTTRPMLAELVPRDELGKFFGLFALSGRAAAVVGPLIWTLAVYMFQPDVTLGKSVGVWLDLDGEGMVRLPYKAGVLSLVVMMLIGAVIFRKVPHPREQANG